ncbi:MAG: macro domain-containing protein [Myxococcota bacterium]
MQIKLCALDEQLQLAWEEAFADVPEVEVIRGNILHLEADAIVSPANSFGYMDGGIDLVYSEFFGWEVEERLRRVLLEQFQGELLVGQAVIVPTEHERFPWLISAPTMRVPMCVDQTVNAMLAFRATLNAVLRHNDVSSDSPIGNIVCPGLGTGEGRMPPERCARQMRYAWEVVVIGHRERKGGLANAVQHHMHLLE